MTAENREKMLEDLKETVDSMATQVREIATEHRELYDAFMGTPLGAPKGTQTLMERLRRMAGQWENTGRVGRLLLYVLTTAALIGSNFEKLWGFALKVFGK